ncbi:MAG TPA: IPT/TIG domain-containing protein [Bryobacteraceae bacterium]|nr:IPT/TIG domain-containing protein [Bryobacteraceae bacterium]
MARRIPSWRAALIAAMFLSAAYGQVNFRYFYDGNGQLFRVLDSSGNLLEYDYDASGNPTQIRRSTVGAGSLAILNVVPARGVAGATVTIYGQNFSTTASGDTVLFNGVAATVVSASSTALVVSVPAGVTTGPVSVTVNGSTVTSGTLNFTVPNLPTITSISPNLGYDGQTVSVTVQGTNLANANFQFLGTAGIQVSSVSYTGNTQANFTATVGQGGGVSVLVAGNDFGQSTSVASNGNIFHVYNPPGENSVSVRLAVFNTFIPLGTEPGVPAGHNFAAENLSVFNTYLAPGTEPGVPAGHNFATENLSVFNSYLAPGSEPGVPAGSRYAFQLFSTNNTATGVQTVPALAISAATPRLAGGAPSTAAGQELETLTAGQTVAVDIAPPSGFWPELQLLADSAVLASSGTGRLKTWFTVPYDVKSLTLQAGGQSALGQAMTSMPTEIAVTPDLGVAITGRVSASGGAPVPGASLTWKANGLTADYYQFNQPLNAVPDLTGLQPARTGYVSALNFPNPNGVFGVDPMGVGLGQNYAVRFHGALTVPAAGDYQFQLGAQAGARLEIDGIPVADNAPVDLTAGEHEIAAIYYQSGGAPAAAQLLWTVPGGVQSVVPPSALTTSAPASVTAGNDGRFRLLLPAALTGVRVLAVHTEGSVVLDQ